MNLNVTFVWYPFMPIACEGNDDDGLARVFKMICCGPTAIQSMIKHLETKHSGYVQVWQVDQSN